MMHTPNSHPLPYEIKSYWQKTAKEQRKILTVVAQAELKAYALDHQLVISKGKAIKPEEYPCKCELQDPERCQKSRGRNWCRCRCHTYYEPF